MTAGTDNHTHAGTAWIRWFAVGTFVLALLSIYPLTQVAPPLRTGALWGWLVSFALCAPSGWLAIWSFGRSLKAFLLVTFGGMLIRLAIVGALIVTVALMELVHPSAFAFGILAPYVIYQALEIYIVHRHRTMHDTSTANS